MLRSGAGISPDGRYRYWLTRSWAARRWVNFVCLNPSTAGVTADDPTVRRLRGFAQAWGFGGFWLTNLYALRAKDPKQLRAALDPVGPDNDAWLASIARKASDVVVAWGVPPRPERSDEVLRILRYAHLRPLRALGFTRQGYPKHPLYLRGDTPAEVMPRT